MRRIDAGHPVFPGFHPGAPSPAQFARHVTHASAACTAQIIYARASESEASRERSNHALKLEPQPQVEVEFGLLKTNPEPMISSL